MGISSKQLVNEAVAIGRLKQTPKWYYEIRKNNGDCAIKYEYLRDAYIYLRSMRKLLDRTKPQNVNFHGDKRLLKIRIELNVIFTEKKFSCLLDVQKIIHSLRKNGLGPELTYREKKEVLKIPKGSGNTDLEPNIEKRLFAFLKNGSKKSAASEWKWRIQTEILNTVNKEKWYPLFGTYTVDPKRLPVGILTRDELWQKTDCWDKFVKKYKADVAESLGYGRKPSKWPKTSTFFKYFAIIEHGKSGNHPHVHVIWLCKNIPQLWKRDPNINNKENTEFDIAPASSLWEHGVQKQTQAIFIKGSPFIDKLGWAIPCKYNEKTEKPEPIEVGDAMAIGGYIAKYLGKQETKKWNHRIKSTKNLGVTQLIKNLRKLNCIPILEALAQRPPTYIQSFAMQKMTKCPMSLLRRISKMELVRRYHSSMSSLGEKSLWKEWTNKPNTFYMKLIDSVSNGQRPWSLTPEQRFNLYTPMLAEVKSTVHCKKILCILKKYLDILTGIDISCRRFMLLQVKE